MATTVQYKGQVLVTVDNSTKVLETSGKWCEDDFTLTDVSSGGYTIDDIISRNITGDIVYTGNVALPEGVLQNTAITSFYAPNVTAFNGANCFYGCAQLKSVSMPNNANNNESRSQIFRNCTSLETVNLPKVKHFGNATFYGDRALVNIALPALLRLQSEMFRNCTSLEVADFGNPDRTNQNTFNGCTSLNTIIIRSTSVCVLTNVNALTGTPFASDGTGGTLYVPNALISSYQSASNWSTILGYATNSIQKIEGSIYETQYADGTPIS